MKLTIKHNFKDIPKELKALADSKVKAAAYRAANETARRVRKTYSQEIRKQINLPASGKSDGGRGRTPPGVKDLLQVRLAPRPSRSASVGSIFATIGTSSRPISLIHFVRGSKEPPRMVGIAPNKRRKTKVMIVKGQAVVRPKMFIQEAKGAVQVWRRINRGNSSMIAPQKIPSLFSLTDRRKIADKVRTDAGEYFSERFLHHLRFAAGMAGKPSKPK